MIKNKLKLIINQLHVIIHCFSRLLDALVGYFIVLQYICIGNFTITD